MPFLDKHGLERVKNHLYALRGAANGVATLDANAKVPVSQMPVMSGASAVNAGTAGAVPSPAAGEEGYFLRGDGTWKVPQELIQFSECVTAGDQPTKEIAQNVPIETLYPGLRITIKFLYPNTADNPKIEIDETGSKKVHYNGQRIESGVDKYLLAGICDFIYDGAQWNLVGNHKNISLIDTVLTIID